MKNHFVVGKYSKHMVNENENLLTKHCEIHNLLITNTMFKVASDLVKKIFFQNSEKFGNILLKMTLFI